MVEVWLMYLQCKITGKMLNYTEKCKITRKECKIAQIRTKNIVKLHD